jgi:sulfur carrier protein
MAKIQLNGKKITIKSKSTIYDLLKKLKLNNKKVAIEFNGIIISKTNYKKKFLKNKDKLEVVHFIGGG